MADQLKVDFTKKRPEKKFCILFITNQHAAKKQGLTTSEEVAKSLAIQNFFLYESEVKEILEANKGKDGFDGKAFIEDLKAWQCVKPGEAPRLGEGQVGVDSLERAKQVANRPEDAEQVQQLMTQMTDLRDKLNPLISDKAACSIALKNKKTKKAKKAQKESAAATS